MTAGELLHITTVANRDTWVMRLAGELDLSSAEQLDTAIAEACADGARRLVIDMDELQFMDSTGLRSLLVGLELCEVSGCQLLIGAVSVPVERLFSVSGVDQRLARLSDPA